MKTVFLFSILVWLGLSIGSCAEGSEPQAAGATEAARVSVTTVPTRTVVAYNSYPARITGVVTSEVRAKIPGYITDVLVDEGDHVRKGQLLFRLETQALNQEEAAAKANVNAAQVEVSKLEPLVAKNIISEVQLETARARLQQAQSGLDGVAANINYGRITSPIDGFLGRIGLRTGALVSPSGTEPLTTVSDISRVYAYFSVTERQYLDFMQAAEGETIEEKIKDLPKVQLELSNGTLYEQEGRVEAVISRVNAQTGTIQVRAVFDNPARLLNDGNSGTIRIPQTYTDAIVVPQTATFDQQGTTYVLRVQPDSTTLAAPLEILTQVDNLYVVASGLSAGDRIVATGVNKLRGGARIQPVPVAFDTIAQPLPTVFR
ncbi:membrane fusion protein (multidrug efflux system) [Neolewinella xylanilytica]|uniref:Membrane fusion protein (Multidrug efflux system) n=1 Tax=Neolewinella xylanilytica TaxID=1514080 RepID=A0A2S6I9M6_9BACT|nr:efflux RND transporter periplasmic adaptor subunit [Neolewinella xylanilytica]PPK88200.1 membrane fusion protein (multidrug efflux system) [Neolewinella xylanilytica]